jgi:uncharacterized membrane protein YfcA
MDLRFSLIGLIIGFLIGLTGMGGGSLMTPIMILVMGVKPIVAVGTDLAYGAVTKIVGGAAHWREGTVHRKTAYFLAAGSVPATVLGVGIVSSIKKADPALVSILLTHAIAWVLILVALVLVGKPALTRAMRSWGTRASGDWRGDLMSLGERRPWLLTILGAVVGFVVGLTSVGSGTLIMVSLLFLYPRWEAKEFVGTDVFHAAILVSAASLAQLAAGNVNVPMMLALLLGSVPGVLIGSRLALGFPEKALRLGLASVLLVSGSQLL